MPLARSGPLRPAEIFARVLFMWIVCPCLACAPKVDSDLSYHRGLNAQALGQHDWARHYFAQDLEQHPDRLESLRQMGIGWISGHEGSLSHGVEAFERYLEQDPDDSQVRLHLARSLFRLRRLPEALEALAPLTAGVQEQPLDFEQVYLRSQILLELKPDEALNTIQAALALRPDSYAARLQAAKVHQRLGHLEQAVAMAKIAIALDPLQADAYVLAANLFRRLGDEAAATETLKKHGQVRQLPSPGKRHQLSPRQELMLLHALEEDLDEAPDSFQQRLALAQIAAGQADEAWPWIEDRIADAGTPISQLADLGQAAREAGQGDRSRQIFERVLERQPDHPGAYTQLIMIHLDLHEFETAQNYSQRALALAPHHGPFHFATGRLHLRAGREVQAEGAMKRAVELVPWFAPYRTALIDVVLARGDRQAALDLLADAPASDPLLDGYRRRLSD